MLFFFFFISNMWILCFITHFFTITAIFLESKKVPIIVYTLIRQSRCYLQRFFLYVYNRKFFTKMISIATHVHRKRTRVATKLSKVTQIQKFHWIREGEKKKGWGKEPLKSTIQSYIEQKKNIWTPKEIFLTLHMYNCRALSK